MKPETIIQQGLKSANILLKNAQKRAAELDHLKGELVIKKVFTIGYYSIVCK